MTTLARQFEFDLTTAEPVDRRGHRLPETLASLDQRDALLCEAAAAFFPDTSHRQAAIRLRTALARYECSAWRRERVAVTVPSRHAGRLDGFCWRILRAVDHVVSVSLIRQILARGSFRCPLDAGSCGNEDRNKR
jgi:hypothetical protein